jgi:hypothetical protein
MPNIYCGSNLNVPEGFVHGNRLQCMKKGYGSCKNLGKQGSLSFQNNVRDPTLPKIYCGMQNLPNGYDRFGHKTECLRKGFGLCLYTPATNQRFNFLSLFSNLWFWLIFIIIMISLILLIIYL